MTRFYLFRDGEVDGPYEGNDLVGRVRADEPVCVEGEAEWREASAFPELFGSSAVSPPLPATNNPGQSERSESVAVEAGSTSSPVAQPSVPAEEKKGTEGGIDLERLEKICRAAGDDLLLRQKKKHWREYYPSEQAVIEKEILRRNL
ncbi:MAG: hypothetical protein D6679_13125 [Candidatus Hydrogenedentota bacterium]|nr:MAG: hypothetical protein D6679_13125 [Candidatus Hydrogenedentota bacterium]